MKLSIIIINHNTKKITQECINSIFKNTYNTNFEIILVDNSTKSQERFRKCDEASNIKVINIPNKGFGNACNIGARISSGEYLLMLNSDTIVMDRCIDNILDYMDRNPQYKAAGCRILLSDGQLDKGCKRNFPTITSSIIYFLKLDSYFQKNGVKYKSYHADEIPLNRISKIDVISGAFFLIKSTAFWEVNGFDEDFFMYGEDIDLCMKLKQHNLFSVYYPKSKIVHLKGASSPQNYYSIYYFYNSMKIFYDKHYSKKHSCLINAIVIFGIYTIMTTKIIKTFFKKMVIKND